MTAMPTLDRKLRQRLIALAVALTLAGVVGLLLWQEGQGADGTPPWLDFIHLIQKGKQQAEFR
ncbi:MULTISPECIES: hypothetical protein [Cyanophyceae]|uniref:hypothetical protein n=1 Tax=Cyanophyceae TaxID=3028117 RepID=UPI0016893BBE|nr:MULTISPECIES: hypothetical protein [Cyanophyceae]MBD1917652.1 hypothetical protein [Phormidium sp. FACHB-77]MBD2031198.1 hypothetical protein [Phormidium sp. FACHB-322]MBD2050734.1 hypothetical protein [Leptolyngbya sp. FACHB-60]